MRFRELSLAASVFACLCTSSWAETRTVQNGSDTFIAGPQITETVTTPGDTFLTARTARVSGVSQGDLHVTGYDVSIIADAAEDLYVAGGTVVMRGNVAEDLSAVGFSVRTESSATTSGNARLFGNSVTIEGPIEGALLVTGRDVVLNAPVKGDARITAQSLSFGPNAVIDGTLTYSSNAEVAVPERVAPAARVVFEKISADRVRGEFSELRKDMPGLPTFASVLIGFIISVLFFVLLGALMLGFMPRRLETMRQSIAAAPGQSLLLGVIGLSMLFGMVPITALTIIGLPFAPIAILAIIAAWTLGYALGAYSVAMRVWSAIAGEDAPSNVARLSVFAGAIVAIALLNYIPFVGWVANYTLVLLGIGAMTNAVFQYLIGNPGIALDVDMKTIDE